MTIDIKPLFYINYIRHKGYIPDEWTFCILGIWFNYMLVHRGTSLFITIWKYGYTIKFPKSVDNRFKKWKNK